MRRVNLRTIARCVLLAAAMAAGGLQSHASTLAEVGTNGDNVAWNTGFAALDQEGTVGWSFQVLGSSLNVTALGVFDNGGSGLADSHEVGIWDNTGALLAEATVPSGTAGTLVDDFRFIAISPLTLQAGDTYTIGAFYPSNSTDSVIGNGSETYNGVSFVESVQTVLTTSQTFAFPDTLAAVNQGVFGPNFEFGATSTPEPSSFVMAGLGLLAATGCRLRRRRTR